MIADGMITEYLWEDNDRENQSTRGKSLSHCHFVHQKSHMEWPDNRPRFSEVRARGSLITSVMDICV